jgi:regulator of cell morphogenesis and NO signaling
MNELTSQTLAQIVTDNHRSAAVFEKYHLDFCCKGRRSLQQACAEQNVSVDQLLNELENISLNRDIVFPFDKLSLSQLADYIVLTHHAYVKNESPQIAAYLQKVASKHGGRHAELFKIFELFTVVKEEMEQHMHKEELVLFPRIKELERLSQSGDGPFTLNLSYLQSPIYMMEMEHEQAGTIMAEIRKLTNNYAPPLDACTTYRLSFAALKAFEQDLHHHVHLENNILFPKALELFKTLAQTLAN